MKMAKRGTWKQYNVIRTSPGNYLTWQNRRVRKKVADEEGNDDLNMGNLAQWKSRLSIPASARFSNWRTLIEYLRWINKKKMQYESYAKNDDQYYFRKIPNKKETSPKFDIQTQHDTPTCIDEKGVRKVRMI